MYSVRNSLRFELINFFAWGDSYVVSPSLFDMLSNSKEHLILSDIFVFLHIYYFTRVNF